MILGFRFLRLKVLIIVNIDSSLLADIIEILDVGGKNTINSLRFVSHDIPYNHIHQAYSPLPFACQTESFIKERGQVLT
jgi:hypothetical protein